MLTAFIVTDMLLAMLNCCTKEELEEESSDEEIEEPLVSPVGGISEESAERRKVIKNKILAVGRMSRVFALLRYVNPGMTMPSLSAHVTIEKSQRRSPSSRASLGLASCRTGRLHWAQRVSRMRLLVSRTRKWPPLTVVTAPHVLSQS